MATELPFSAAAERNTPPILGALEPRIANGSRVLEIGSGTGQHCCSLAPALAVGAWQPTELPDMMDALTLRVRATDEARILAPMVLDVTSDGWPVGPFDHVFTANTFHIMSWSKVLACLRGVSGSLPIGGTLLVYGPFRDGEVHNAASNEAFDMSLRERDPEMGIRDIHRVVEAAAAVLLELAEELHMPANNRLLLFRKFA